MVEGKGQSLGSIENHHYHHNFGTKSCRGPVGAKMFRKVLTTTSVFDSKGSDKSGTQCEPTKIIEQ